MSYVIAAYGVTVLTLLLYGIHLSRERRALSRDGDQITVDDQPAGEVYGL